MNRSGRFGVAVVFGVSVTAGLGSARAAAIFDFVQVGSGVVGTLSGSLNLTGAQFQGTTPSFGPTLDPRDGQIIASPGPFNVNPTAKVYAATGPVSFGTTFGANGTATGSGPFELTGFNITVPIGYGGTSFDNTLTIANQTLSSLGITPGDYVYTLTGSNDTVTVRFEEPLVVPVLEPSALALMASGLGLVFVTRRRRVSVRPSSRSA